MMRQASDESCAGASVRTSRVNAAKVEQARDALNELFGLAMRRGFYGSVALEVNVQDGTIQNLRKRLEQLQK